MTAGARAENVADRKSKMRQGLRAGSDVRPHAETHKDDVRIIRVVSHAMQLTTRSRVRLRDPSALRTNPEPRLEHRGRHFLRVQCADCRVAISLEFRSHSITHVELINFMEVPHTISAPYLHVNPRGRMPPVPLESAHRTADDADLLQNRPDMQWQDGRRELSRR